MRNRPLIFLVTALMVLAVLTGCTQSPTTQTTTTATTQPTAQETAAATAAPTTTEEPVTIVIYPNNGAQMQESGSTADKYEELQQYILQQTGVLVESILPPTEGSAEKLALLLAGGDQLDCWWGNWGDYASKDMIQPINDLLELYGQNVLLQESDVVFKSMTDADGNIWGIGRYISMAAYPVFIRGDWLDSLGLSIPNTLDDLENILYTFKEEDPAGGGTTIPLETRSVAELEYTLVGAFVETGASPWLDSSDGSIKPLQLAPGYIDFLTLMAKWYQDGIIYEESFGLDQSSIRELVQRGTVGASATWFTNVSTFVEAMIPNFPDSTWVFNENGITGDAGQLQTCTKSQPFGALISSKCEHPEAVMKVFDWQYSDLDNYETVALGIKGTDWDWDADSLAQGKYRLSSDYDMDPAVTGYAGDFIMAFSSMMAGQLAPNITEYGTENYNRAYLNYHGYYPEQSTKEPFDLYLYWDTSAIASNVSTLDDINRTIESETTKFIMGERPLSEYDDFVQELYSMGLQDWIDEYTRQYNELT